MTRRTRLTLERATTLFLERDRHYADVTIHPEKVTTDTCQGPSTLSPRTGRRPETPAYGPGCLGVLGEPTDAAGTYPGMTVAILVTNVIGPIVGACYHVA